MHIPTPVSAARWVIDVLKNSDTRAAVVIWVLIGGMCVAMANTIVANVR